MIVCFTAALSFLLLTYARRIEATLDLEDKQLPTTGSTRKLWNTNVFNRPSMALPSQVLSTAANIQDQPSDNRFDEMNIIGGQPARIEKYPFYVHPSGSVLCGGTLIWPDVILTAAHCMRAWSIKQAFIGATQISGNDATERLPIKRAFPHPNHDEENFADDIMLVLLDGLSEAPLATLNRNRTAPINGQEVTAIGFGRTRVAGEASQILLEVEVNVVGMDECFNQLLGNVIPEIHVCAGVREGSKGPCHGDSGGPLLDSRTLIQYGLASYVLRGCATPGSPTVYIDVSVYAAFIDDFLCQYSADPPENCSGQFASDASSTAPSMTTSKPVQEAFELPERTMTPSILPPGLNPFPTILPTSGTSPPHSTAPVTATHPTFLPQSIPTLPPQPSTSSTASSTPVPKGVPSGSERPEPIIPVVTGSMMTGMTGMSMNAPTYVNRPKGMMATHGMSVQMATTGMNMKEARRMARPDISMNMFRGMAMGRVRRGISEFMI